MKKTCFILLAVTLVAAGSVAGVRAWRYRVVRSVEARAFAQAGRLLREGHPTDALAVIDHQLRRDCGLAWESLELQALVAARHVPRLMALHRREPDRLRSNEEAALLVARALFAARQTGDFTSLRSAWRGREVQAHLWLALDADILGLENHGPQAEQLLRSRHFDGEAEATRLVRLALHAAPRSLYESWTLLDRACSLAPRNPDVRSFRGQILESIGRTAEARVEHVAAHVADPRNPLMRDELAEFYRRQGSHDLALATWRNQAADTIPDFMALKKAFWGRLIDPAPPGRTPAGITRGSLTELAAAVRSLPTGVFWDTNLPARLALPGSTLQERQEVFWLQLLECLRTGRETQAAELLRHPGFKGASWEPDLAAALARILHFRTHRTLQLTARVAPVATTASNRPPRHAFLARVLQPGPADAAHLPADLVALLDSPDVFAAACVAAGWREAALQLRPARAFPAAPIWYDFGLAQCLRFNRGIPAALELLEHRSDSPELAGLRGELLLAAGRQREAAEILARVARHPSDAGYRAAWQLACHRLETGDAAGARAVIQGHPKLAAATTGRELLARISMAENNPTAAARLYESMAADSVEAAAFLARRAYEQRDWAAARRHTVTLQRTLPDALQLRENLLAIDRAEHALETR